MIETFEQARQKYPWFAEICDKADADGRQEALLEYACPKRIKNECFRCFFQFSKWRCPKLMEVKTIKEQQIERQEKLRKQFEDDCEKFWQDFDKLLRNKTFNVANPSCDWWVGEDLLEYLELCPYKNGIDTCLHLKEIYNKYDEMNDIVCSLKHSGCGTQMELFPVKKLKEAV